jgi:hypothetical protein
VDVGQVQADELYTKTQAGPVWLATALTVFSRLWLWGAIGWERDAALVAPVLRQVRAAAHLGRPILFALDGFTAYLTVILKVFRDPLRSGKRGRPRLQVWDELHIVQVVKRRVGRRLVSISRRRVRQMEEKLRRGEEWHEHGLVFPTSVGTPFSPRNLIDD